MIYSGYVMHVSLRMRFYGRIQKLIRNLKSFASKEPIRMIRDHKSAVYPEVILNINIYIGVTFTSTAPTDCITRVASSLGVGLLFTSLLCMLQGVPHDDVVDHDLVCLF